MSSNQISSVKVPILKLNLLISSLSDGSGTNSKTNKFKYENQVPTTKVISFELTNKELVAFIQTLEDSKQTFFQALTI